VEWSINELGQGSPSQETPLSQEVRELQRTLQGRFEREIQHHVDALRQLQLEIEQMLDAKETEVECRARLLRLRRHEISWLERELQRQDSEDEVRGSDANLNRPGPPGDTATTAKGSRPQPPPSSGATDDGVGTHSAPPPPSFSGSGDGGWVASPSLSAHPDKRTPERRRPARTRCYTILGRWIRFGCCIAASPGSVPPASHARASGPGTRDPNAPRHATPCPISARSYCSDPAVFQRKMPMIWWRKRGESEASPDLSCPAGRSARAAPSISRVKCRCWRVVKPSSLFDFFDSPLAGM
jgi:hypothetical protein